jgi:uncharacterized hydrophobic protein (TIGR00271 family)
VLHLRAICPSEHTEAVVAALREHPGVAHVVLLPGAAVAPKGDVVEADIAREATDGVISALCQLGVDHSGGITLEQIDTALSDAADRAEENAPGDGADAVVWEELLARTGEESRLNVTFLAFLAIACLLAAVGVITDSTVTVVGAMVVGPEFGPLAAIAVGFPLAMLVTAGGTALGNAAGLFDASAIAGDGHQVDFVYDIGPWSLIVALLAGAAGMLSMTSAKSAALVGVFISVTTVPAAGYASVAAILGEWDRVLESVAQLVINLVGIVLAATLVLVLRRATWTTSDAGRPLSNG